MTPARRWARPSCNARRRPLLGEPELRSAGATGDSASERKGSTMSTVRLRTHLVWLPALHEAPVVPPTPALVCPRWCEACSWPLARGHRCQRAARERSFASPFFFQFRPTSPVSAAARYRVAALAARAAADGNGERRRRRRWRAGRWRAQACVCDARTCALCCVCALCSVLCVRPQSLVGARSARKSVGAHFYH